MRTLARFIVPEQTYPQREHRALCPDSAMSFAARRVVPDVAATGWSGLLHHRRISGFCPDS